ncbi:uncharacterized protein LOC144580801 [Callithrix jacchus]
MGQSESKNKLMFTKLLHQMLRNRGVDVKKKHVSKFLEIVYVLCPWVPEEGSLDKSTWSKIGTKIEEYAAAHQFSPQAELLLSVWPHLRQAICLPHCSPGVSLASSSSSFSSKSNPDGGGGGGNLPPCNPLNEPDSALGVGPEARNGGASDEKIEAGAEISASECAGLPPHLSGCLSDTSSMPRRRQSSLRPVTSPLPRLTSPRQPSPQMTSPNSLPLRIRCLRLRKMTSRRVHRQRHQLTPPQKVPVPTWTQMRHLVADASHIVRQQGHSLNPVTLFLAMLAIFSCDSTSAITAIVSVITSTATAAVSLSKSINTAVYANHLAKNVSIAMGSQMSIDDKLEAKLHHLKLDSKIGVS